MPIPQGDITTSEILNPPQEVKEEPKQEEEKEDDLQ